ncbi:pre-rRNA-processing factor PNO1 [Babesia ovis]|uniref:Pre-rRNA-processing factor PNO1 n=1 Tax=Babesia ovis TaxID=5869 RepID=A0A9W5T9V8_BABOV|nr:pre-rRNA-processing factor PNO1 [Babesia ovis]
MAAPSKKTIKRHVKGRKDKVVAVKGSKEPKTESYSFVNLRRVSVPPNRLTPLRNNWETIVRTIVEHLKLQIRMCTKNKVVEVRPASQDADLSLLQKAQDYLRAFMLGFELKDAEALIRLEDIFIESFDIKDVKRLNGDHLSRCIGRISGKNGKTKHAIENMTRTRIVLAEDRIHIMGSFNSIKMARHSICSLILGNQPGKVYNNLQSDRYHQLKMIPCVSDKRALALLVATNIFYFTAYVLRIHPLRVLINIAICAICLGGIFKMISGKSLYGGLDENGEHREFVKSDCISGILEFVHKGVNCLCAEICTIVLWKSPVKSVNSLVALYIFGLFARLLSISALFFFAVWLFCGWLSFRDYYYTTIHAQVKPAYDHVKKVVLNLYSTIPRFNESQKL